MRLFRIVAALSALSLPVTALLLSYSDGPSPGLTGGFGDSTCLDCHSSFSLNEGRTRGGTFYLKGVPKAYVPGQRYPITVTIGQPGQQRWGFELSSRFSQGGLQAGTLQATDSFSQVQTAGGVEFASHTTDGSRPGLADGPVEFVVEWTAPATASGPVLFNASGNAANGDNNTTGDYVFTASAFTRGAGEEIGVEPVAQAPDEGRPQGRRLFDDGRLIHTSTPVDLSRGNAEVVIHHRFLGGVVEDGSLNGGDAFGLDFGANINLGLAYAVTDRVSVGVSRERFDKRVSFAGTVELVTQEDAPFKLSLRSGMEGAGNFQRHHSAFIEVPAQWDYKAVRFYTTPILVLNSRPDAEAEFRPDPVEGDQNHTFALGLGTDLAINRRISLVGEYIPRLAGFGGFGIERASMAGGLKIRTWGHVFNVVLTNNRFMTPTRYAVNATTNDYALGFNIYRKVGR